MPKLPVLKDRELIRALERLGFFQHRQQGTSHLVMKHPNGRRAVIAIHAGRDIPNGTLRAILRDIEVSVDDLLGVL